MRKVLFWLHLVAGLLAGVVIFIMSVTGVLLMYEKQTVAWFDLRGLPAIAGPERLPAEELLTRARQQKGKLPTAMQWAADPQVPVQLTMGREIVYQDPSNGKILGAGDLQVRAFFRTVTDWHRWLALSGEQRPWGRSVTGYANLAFLFLVLSGIYLWMPKVWTKARVRAVALLQPGLAGKARDFNWHNVFGIWAAVPLVLVVSCATVISFPWASNLVYSLTGTKPPAPAGAPAPASSGGAGAKAEEFAVAGLNALWSKAAGASQGWRTLTMRLPAGNEQPVAFVLDHGYAGQPQKRLSFALDRATGEMKNRESFADFNQGRQIRTWMRFVHTGEYYGLLGQSIAGIASAAAAVLVFTGIALSLRRWKAWRGRKARNSTAATAASEVLVER